MANNQKTVLALLAGAVIGAGVGLLYAPYSGSETRRRMGESTKGAHKKANQKIKETTTSFSTNANRILSRLEQSVDETLSSVSYKADDILGSLETKLEELRRQNKRFQKDDSMDDMDTAIASNGTSSKTASKKVSSEGSKITSEGSKSTSGGSKNTSGGKSTTTAGSNSQSSSNTVTT